MESFKTFAAAIATTIISFSIILTWNYFTKDSPKNQEKREKIRIEAEAAARRRIEQIVPESVLDRVSPGAREAAANPPPSSLDYPKVSLPYMRPKSDEPAND